MLHPDEGIIHELLDGELAASEAETVRRHLEECGDCRRVYQEAQELVAESDRAIALLDDTRPELNEAAPDERYTTPGLPPPPAANVRAGPPIVLMPGAAQPARWRRVRPRNGLWAAALLLLAGGGYLVFGRSTEPSQGEAGTPTLENFPLTSKAAPAPDSAADAQAEARAAAALAARPPLGAPPAAVPKTDSASKRDQRTTDTATKALATADRAADDRPAGNELTKPATEPAPARALAARSQRAAADLAATEKVAQENAAPSREAEPPAAPPPAPTPPSLDTQAKITTRIGLDDAKRELGAPLHGIDGLRPRLVGLIPGRLVPGADPSRNVVRAVYTDRNGTPFFLDQQRISGSGGQRPTGGLVRGDVQLFLNGDLSADSAGALAQRVR